MTSKEQVAVLLHRPGNEKDPAAHLVAAKVAVPSPGPGEALVRLLLRPINPADMFSLMGVYPGFTPKSYPAVPGLEGMGVVEALGSNVTGRIAAGQRVASLGWRTPEGNGTWQQYVTVPEDTLVPVPDGVSDEAAAVAFVNPVTIVGMMETAAVPAGEWLLLTASRSTLARNCLHYAKRQGVKVVGTVRRKEQVQEMLQLGFDAVVDSTEENWPHKVMQITGGKGAYACFDAIAGDVTNKCVQALRPCGEVLVYGAVASPEIKLAFFDLLSHTASVRGFWLVQYLAKHSPAERQAILAKVLQLFKDGVFVPFVGEVLPLEKAADAVRAQAGQGPKDKFMLRG